MNRDLIEKTEAFLKDKLNSGEYMSSHPEEKNYRIEHSFRVANIGLEIAKNEHIDETEMVVGCLLHDISYCEDFGNDGWIEHGRRSAAIARNFLSDTEIAKDRADDICYGIAIHVDDKADFEGERTPFALSIGDADNIDRFDALRIHETLINDGFDKMNIDDKLSYLKNRITKLTGFIDMPMATETAIKMWRERLDFYICFCKRLLNQLEISEKIG